MAFVSEQYIQELNVFLVWAPLEGALNGQDADLPNYRLEMLPRCINC
jgi:hypothetical protein